MKSKQEFDTASRLPYESKCREASLYFKEGGSDKVYEVFIQEILGGYQVKAFWGRRGSTLQHGLKTQHPTSLDEATAIFQKIVAEKERKGYRRSVEASEHPSIKTHAARVPDAPDAPERFFPQLLNPLTEDALEPFLARLGPQWGAQEKYDGKRILLVKTPYDVSAFNKLGKLCVVASQIMNYARELSGAFVMDGEAIGADYFAFDLLECAGADHRHMPYGARYRYLLKLIGVPNGWPIQPAPLITGDKAVRKFIAELRARNAEGVVFKDLLAPYTAGRPASGGPQLKCKFYATCSAIVVAQNEKRSVALALALSENDTNGLIIGNVTIPPNHDVPAVGHVVEVRYLYAYKGGALYKPVYLGARDDVPVSDCTLERQALKFKAEQEAT